jgi:GH15 family glucan-1,4-alpha-glucosidase
VDAALLLPALRGAVDPRDPVSVATVDAVRRELGRDGYVYRFRQAPGPLNDAEGAFILCGFQMALATYQQGDEVEAVRWFERNRSALGPPGLFTEEFDVVQRQLRGNLPQAFVHALLIESAVTLRQPPDPRPYDGAPRPLEQEPA